MPPNNTTPSTRPADQAVPPVAFLIFNRPEYTRQVFAQIRLARPKQLFIVADGPRTPEEAELCEETRGVTEHIDWPCEVRRDYAVENLGLKERISSGLNWFFGQVEAGIILEDDCLPHPSFFRFAGEMLERYRDDERIMMISGDNFLPDIDLAPSYAFSRYFPIWGWATWRRAWQHYDVEMKGWQNAAGGRNNSGNAKMFDELYPKDQKYMRVHMKTQFDNLVSGKTRTWDVQWLYACLKSRGFCVIPRKNLVSNIGAQGTHSGGNNQHLSTYDLYAESQLVHPTTLETGVSAAAEYDRTFYERNFRPEPFDLKRTLVSLAVRSGSLKKLYRLVTKKST